MPEGQRVLVVDGLPETAEVLRTVLEPRGTRVDHLREGEPRGQLGGKPRLVVVHPESDDLGVWNDVPRVVVGAVESSDGGAVPGLFQYRDLVRAIDAALAE